MSTLRDAIEEYLTVRRSLGYQVRGVGYALRAFAGFAERDGATRVTTDLALRWASQSSRHELATVATRLRMVRRFAQWRQATDPRTEVPPGDLLRARYQRHPPYLYSDEEIDQLLRAARNLRSPAGLRGLTYYTVFGLLAATGLRVSEGVALDETDVDLHAALVTIRRTKFGKSRLVPLHVSTIEPLARYGQTRNRVLPRRPSAAFFVSEQGARLTVWAADYAFARISGQIGLRPPIRGHHYGHGPRLHDLRHRFASRTLLGWYRAGVDVEQALPRLATYLGHVHVNDTYWYLEAVPELLELATERVLNTPPEMAP